MQRLPTPSGAVSSHGMRLLLARHAETSAPDRFHGAESDIGLSDWGIRQAQLLGDFLKEARAHRHLLIGDASGDRHCGPDRSGVSFGSHGNPHASRAKNRPLERSFTRRRLGDLRGDQGTMDRRRPRLAHAGGESYADISRRIAPIFADLTARHRGETIIVVAHGVVIRVLITTLVSGFQPADFDRIAIDFASVNDLLFDGTTWTASSLNQCVAASPAQPVA